MTLSPQTLRRTEAWLVAAPLYFLAAVAIVAARYSAFLDICDVNFESPNTLFGWSVAALTTLAIVGHGLATTARRVLVVAAGGLAIVLWLYLLLPAGTC